MIGEGQGRRWGEGRLWSEGTFEGGATSASAGTSVGPRGCRRDDKLGCRWGAGEALEGEGHWGIALTAQTAHRVPSSGAGLSPAEGSSYTVGILASLRTVVEVPLVQ